MRARYRWIAAVTALCLTPGALLCQRVAPAFAHYRPAVAFPSPRTDTSSATSGIPPASSASTIVGATVGALAGTFLGGYLAIDVVCGGDIDCHTGSEGLAVGLWALLQGGTTALGAHLGNNSAGSWPADFAVAVGVMAAGLTLAAASDGESGLGIAILVVQVAAVTTVERRTGWRRVAEASP